VIVEKGVVDGCVMVTVFVWKINVAIRSVD
jgi:hypothetical protein